MKIIKTFKGEDIYEIYIVTSMYFGDIYMIMRNGEPFASENKYSKAEERVKQYIQQ